MLQDRPVHECPVACNGWGPKILVTSNLYRHFLWFGVVLHRTWFMVRFFSTTTFTKRVVTAANISTAVNRVLDTALSAVITY